MGICLKRIGLSSSHGEADHIRRPAILCSNRDCDGYNV